MQVLRVLCMFITLANAAAVLTRDGSIVLQVAEGKTVNIASDPTTLTAANMVVTQVCNHLCG